MLNLDEFMKKTGVRAKSTIKEWIKNDLIPGVIKAPSLEDTLFPNSARRPYKFRSHISQKADTINIRAHIVRASIAKEYISYKMCYCTLDEFDGYVTDLTECGLIRIREEDRIRYLDATYKCDQIRQAKHSEIAKFVADTVQKAAIEAEKAYINAALK